ncbi:MAG: tetratricopeptide repeat protein [Proteobacteria bacterium]|nr:tetratricopeptide repeat protein [Pseudomonadota bacterium]
MKYIILFLVFFTLLFTGCRKMENKPQSSTPPQQLQQTINYAEKIESLKALLKEHPESLNGWIQLGNYSMDAGLFKDAINAYEKALSIDPNNVDVRVDLGTCYRETGNPKRAIEEYNRALKIKPDHANALKNSAVVYYYDLKDPKSAINALEKYLKYYPNAQDKIQILSWLEDMKNPKR